jgi:glycolate oxidase FAD binding subunit
MTTAGPTGADELRALLGDDLVHEEPPVRVDTHELGLVARPADGEALGATLATLGAHGLAAVVRGGGTRLSLGNHPRRADLILSTEAIAGVQVFDIEDGVAHVLGGTKLSDVRSAVNPEGWDVPLDPWGRTSSVGGTLASGAIGPRRQGFGAVRDCVLGLDVVLASGTRTRCGGRVVKNVTGYDLAKLYTGSFGTLGVIEAAWLRLKPLPEMASTQLALLPGDQPLVAPALAAARRPTTRVGAYVSSALASQVNGGAAHADVRGGEVEERRKQWLLVVEFAGDEPAVRADLRWFESEFDALPACVGEAGHARVEELRALQGGELGPEALRVRMAVLPSALGELLADLETSAPDVGKLVFPDLGLVYAVHEPGRGEGAQGGEAGDQRERLGAALRGVERAARRVGAHLLYEHLPGWAKQDRDVFGDAGESLALMHALKNRFDPASVLNPGRFMGRL